MFLPCGLSLLLVILCVDGRYYSGSPAGYMPTCPGNGEPLTLEPRALKTLTVTIIGKTNNKKTQHIYHVRDLKSVARDPHIRRHGKVLVWFSGYMENSQLPYMENMIDSYLRRNYTVITYQTMVATMYLYPVAARMVGPLGEEVGDLLSHLYTKGLPADNIRLIGISLGSHMGSWAARRFWNATGESVGRLTGLDPSGPCFREVPENMKFHRSAAKRVDALHTNIDGFGTAEPSGHVDFYANGGEYQPFNVDNFILPCLTACSHASSFIFWYASLDHPKDFIGIKCDSVQDARYGNCFKNGHVTNVLGPKTNFNKPGLYYLPTMDKFPFGAGKSGLTDVSLRSFMRIKMSDMMAQTSNNMI